MKDRNNIFGEPEDIKPAQPQKADLAKPVPQAQKADRAQPAPQRPSPPPQRERSAGGPAQPPQKGKRGRGRLVLAIVADILIAAAILAIFYFTNYEMGSAQQGTSLPVPSKAATPSPVKNTASTQPGVSASPAASPDTSPVASADPSSWRVKYADKFTGGDVQRSETSYKSANVSINIEKKEKDGAIYRVVDIYVADLQYFKTGFAKTPDVMKKNNAEHATEAAKRCNAIVAVNGDYCTLNPGIVVRNGQWFDNGSQASDQLVLGYDGTMQVYGPGNWT